MEKSATRERTGASSTCVPESQNRSPTPRTKTYPHPDVRGDPGPGAPLFVACLRPEERMRIDYYRATPSILAW